AAVRRRLAAFRLRGGRIVASARSAKIASPAAGGIPNAVLLTSDDGRVAFLDVVNYERSRQHVAAAHVHAGGIRYDVPQFTVAARDAALIPLTKAAAATSHAEVSPSHDEVSPSHAEVSPSHAEVSKHPEESKGESSLPLRPDASIATPLREIARHTAIAYAADVYSDGYPAVVLENDALRLIVSPCSGARALIFEDKATGENLFTTIGGLREAWSPQLPPSPRDYIAKYTHPIPAGTFNRCYAYQAGLRDSSAYATFAYTAPDAPQHGATFHRTIVMRPNDTAFEIISSAQFTGSSNERPLQISSLALSPSSQILRVADGYGIFDAQRGRVTLVAWNAAGVAAHAIARHPGDALITLLLHPGSPCHVYYGVSAAASEAQAQARLRAFANRRPSSRSAGEVAER
ncbi:MAG TPA: hypothetical protein VGZ02_02360, partial [Candidatus Baltobacteraceae bacterium]|nr:hypothetical protein [Candidatus Baltobacteraceae bacterium]